MKLSHRTLIASALLGAAVWSAPAFAAPVVEDGLGSIDQGNGTAGRIVSDSRVIQNYTLNNFRRAGTSGAAGQGGAILVTGTGNLTLNNVNFTGNSAVGGSSATGNGGDGLGGAIYVTAGGSLTMTGNGNLQFNATNGGSGAPGFTGGRTAGTDLFIEKGASVNLAAGAGNTLVFNGTIADNSQSSLAGAPNGVGSGAGLTVSSGTVVFNGVNTYSGVTTIAGGVLRANDQSGININSNINFAGGVLETSGTFSRFLGTDGDRVQWTGNGGFSARGGALTVSLDGGAQVTWGAPGSFVPDTSALIFGAASSTHDVTFVNAINMATDNIRVIVNQNATNTTKAVMSGVLSNGALTLGNGPLGTEAGHLQLTAANTYAGGTSVLNGTLSLSATGSLNANGVLLVDATFDTSAAGNRAVGDLSGAATGRVNLGANRLTVNQAGDSTFAGVIADGGLVAGTGASLTKAGAGNLTLSGANTFTGAARIDAGTLTLTGSLVTTSIQVAAGATLDDVNGGLVNAAVVAVDGTLNLGADETVTTLNATGAIKLTGGSLTVSNGTVSGVISGANGLTKTSSGSLTLSGANTFAGAFNANAGTTVLSGSLATNTVNVASGATLNNTAAGLASGATLTNSGTVALTLSDTIAAYVGSGTLNGTGRTLTAATYTLHTGAVINANLGTGAFTSDGDATLNGTSAAATHTVASGILTLGAAERLDNATTLTVASGAKVILGGAETVKTLDGAGTVDITAGNLTLSDGAFSGVIASGNDTSALIKTSLGELTLSGANTFTGETRVTNGTLTLATGGSLASRLVTVAANKTLNNTVSGLAADATLDNAGIVNLGAASDTVAAFVNTGTLNGTGTLTAATYDLDDGSIINANLGEGTLTANGAVALNGTSAAATVTIASGVTTLGAAERLADTAAVAVTGRLVLGGDEAIGSLTGTGVVTADLGVLTVSSGDFSGVIEGIDETKGLTKTGTGTLTLSGVNTYVGVTRVNAGTLALGTGGSLESRSIVIASGAKLENAVSGFSSLAALENNGELALGADDTVDTLVNTGLISGTGTLTARTYALNGGSDIRANLGLGEVTANGEVSVSGAILARTVTIASGVTTLTAAERLADDASVTVNGTLALGGAEAIGELLGSGTVNTDNGALTVATGDFAGDIAGTSGLVKVSTGELTLSGTSTGTGALRITDGTLTLTGATAAASVVVESNGTFVNTNGGLADTVALTLNGRAEFQSDETLGALTGSGTLDFTDTTLTVASGDFAGDLTGDVLALVKSGDGVLTLSGANTYSGDTRVEAGNLVLTGSLDSTRIIISSGATLTSAHAGLAETADVFNSGTLDLGATDDTVGYYAASGRIIGTGTLTAATYRLNNGASVEANLGSGNLYSSGDVTISGTVAAEYILIESSSIALMAPGSFAMAAPVDGTTTTVGSHRFTGLPRLDVYGKLALGGDETVSELYGYGSIALGGALTVGQGWFSGVLSGEGSLVKDTGSSLSLTGENTYTGDTTVAAGDLYLYGSLASGRVVVNESASLYVYNGALADTATLHVDGYAEISADDEVAVLTGSGQVYLSDNTPTLHASGPALMAMWAPTTPANLRVGAGDFGGSVSGAGSLTKVSDGTLTLSGENTYTGATRVSGGTLALTGSLVSTDVSVDSGATLRVTNGGLSADTVLVNAGTVVVDGAKQTITTLDNTGTVNGDSKLTASSYLLRDGSVINVALGAGSLETFGAVTLAGTSEAGSVTVHTGSVLTLASKDRLDDGAVLTVDGTLALAGGDDTVGELYGSGVIDGGSKHRLVVTRGGYFTGTVVGGVGKLLSQGDLTITGATTTDSVDVASGTLTLSGTGTITTGETLVGSGSTLVLESGSTLDSDLLRGAGTVDNKSAYLNKKLIKGNLNFTGDLVNTGTLAPGNSPGITTVAGNYTESGTLEIELAGNGGVAGTDFDQVRASSVTLTNSGTLVVQGFGGFAPQRGQVFQAIADASGAPIALTGTLAGVTFDLDGVAGPGAPVANAAVVLDLASGRVIATGLNASNSTFADLGKSSNERTVAAAIFAGAQLAPNQIDSTTAAGTAVENLLTNPGSANLSFFVPDCYSALLDYGVASSHLAERLVNRVDNFNALPGAESGRGAFYAGMINAETNTEHDDARFSRNDFYAGADFAAGKSLTLGLFADKSDGSVRSDMMRSKADGIAGGAYLKAAVSDRVSVKASFTYANDEFETKRRTLAGNVTSESTVDTYSGQISAEYVAYRTDAFSLAPRAGLVATEARSYAFTEGGASDALHLADTSSTRISARAGASAVWTKKWFSLEVVGDVDQALYADAQDLDASFSAQRAVGYSVTPEDNNYTSFIYGVNAGASLSKSTSLYLGYQGRVGYLPSNDVNVSVRVRF